MLGRSRPLLLILAGLLASGSTVEGQEDVPDPDSPPVTPAALPSDRLEAIEARLRVLEEQNRQLSEENQELRRLIGTTPPATTGAEPPPPATDHQVMGTQSLADVAGELLGPMPVPIDGTSPARSRRPPTHRCPAT